MLENKLKSFMQFPKESESLLHALLNSAPLDEVCIRSATAWRSRCIIIEYQVERDLKDHLVPPFLVKHDLD